MERRRLIDDIIEEETTADSPAADPFSDVFEEGYGTQPPYHVSRPIIAERPARRHITMKLIKNDIGHFDPTGVAELERKMTRRATRAQGNLKRNKRLSSVSEVTLVGDNDSFDFADCLRGFIKGDKTRSLGVMFKDLKVVGLDASVSYQPTLGSVLNPLNIIGAIDAFRHPPVKDILAGFEGVVLPGEMLLVLGRPGSGCSTFLKTLVNQRKEYHSVEGEVRYDYFSPDDIAKYYRGDVTYCPEDDVHFPTLTVEQTLRFAATTRAPQRPSNDLSREDFITEFIDILMTIFGLKHAKDTVVGDVAIRGVSGGEKKRVSISETLAMRSLIGAWDNSTRGLDSSTALEFVRALRIATDIGNLTTIVSIHQASESIYKLFDKVCVIYEGKMVYYGPADEARRHFYDMGYEPAHRQTTADFLVATTDPSGRTERSPGVSIPRTATDFAYHFQKSALAQTNRYNIQSYRNRYVESVNTKHPSPYMISIPMQARAVLIRRIQIFWGMRVSKTVSFFSVVMRGIMMGLVFIKLPHTSSAFLSRGGILFFALLLSALPVVAEIPALFSHRAIISRHHKAALYHPFVEAAALTLADAPITLITTLVYGVVLYEIVQFQQTAGQLFVFLAFTCTMAITIKSFARALATTTKDPSSAQALTGLLVVIFGICAGYSPTLATINGGFRWITHLNPLRYGFEGLMVNEFRTLNGSCTDIIPQGPGYENVGLNNQVCSTVGSLPGQAFVDGNLYLQLSFGFSSSNMWRDYAFLVIFGCVFTLAFWFFAEFVSDSSTSTSVTLFKRGSQTWANITMTTSVDEEMTAARAPLRNPNQSVKQPFIRKSMTGIFSWHHMQYTVPIDKEQYRCLLDDVSGYVVPGKLTALMGESGAGKTTLLNVLAGRVGAGIVSGDRLINGQPLPVEFLAQVGYCQQLDIHVPTATVREALLFSAMTRQPSSVPLSEKEAYVETCLSMCGLESYGDAIIGSLTLEHCKRTSIAVELAAKPKLLLFLDEPTSGLDSQSARAIVSCLKTLAENGQAILCTIHQPSAELFQAFDRLLLLGKGGKTAYFGDIGHNSTTLIRYFENNGSRACDSDENPAEFMLDVIGAGATATSKNDWHTTWKRSPQAVEAQQEIDKMYQRDLNQPLTTTPQHSEFAIAWRFQFFNLSMRNAQRHWRDPTYLLAKLGLCVVGGLFIGFAYFKSPDSLQGINNKLLAVHFSTFLSLPLAFLLHGPFFEMRRLYNIRERSSNMYSWTAMIASQIVIEIPWNTLGSSLFFACLYWTVGFDSDRAAYTYLLLGITYPIYYTTFSMAVAAMSPHAQIAGSLFSLFFFFVLGFCGVMQPFDQLGWWKWMYHLTPLTYLMEGIMVQTLGQQNITCSSQELVTLNPPSGLACGDYMQIYISNFGGYLVNPAATDSCAFCSSRTTDAFLESVFNMEFSHRFRDFWIVLGYIVFNTCCIYGFTYLFHIRTGNLLVSIKKRIIRKSRRFTTRPLDEETQLEEAALLPNPWDEHEAKNY